MSTRPTPPTPMTAFFVLMRNGIRLNLLTRRSVFLAVFSLMPVGVAVLFLIISAVAPQALESGPKTFNTTAWLFYLQVLAPLAMLFFGSGIVREELEGKTLTYLTTRPIPKWTIILGRYAALVIVANVVLQSSMLVTYVLFKIRQPRFLFRDADVLVVDMVALAIALLAYGALFTAIGTQFKKAGLFGFFYIFGWEALVSKLPTGVQLLTLQHYVSSVLSKKNQSGIAELFQKQTPWPVAVLVLLAFAAVMLGLACWRFGRREYLLSEDSNA